MILRAAAARVAAPAAREKAARKTAEADRAETAREGAPTVRDLQKTFGFSTPQAIYKWQRGTALPTVDNLIVLALVFGVTIEDILICH